MQLLTSAPRQCHVHGGALSLGLPQVVGVHQKGCSELTLDQPCCPNAQSRYTADLDIQRKEMSLDPGCTAYNVAVRAGLCNAYLAASVVCSGLVSTSKVGAMGKVGAVGTFELLRV